MLKTHRWISLIFALLFALLSPLSALGEAPPQGGMFMMRSQMGRYNVDRANLSDLQKNTYEQALSDYAAIEDKCLAELVSAGEIEQQEVDMFIRTRSTQGAMASMEMDKWDQMQLEAFQSAMAASDSDRVAAFDALVASGQLTQAQADAFSGMQVFLNRRVEQGEDASVNSPRNPRTENSEGNDGNMRQAARNIDIWTRILDLDQTENIQKVLSEIQAAQQAFSQALTQAGIQMID